MKIFSTLFSKFFVTRGSSGSILDPVHQQARSLAILSLILAGGVPVLANAKGHADLAKILVTEPGIQRVSFEQLRDAGVNLSGIKTKKLILKNNGETVPIRFTGKGGGSKKFKPGMAIEFIGKQVKSLYTDENPYILGYGQRSGNSRVLESKRNKLSRSAVSESHFMDTVKSEPENRYATTAPSDPWYADFVFSTGSVSSKSVGINLPHCISGMGPVTATMNVWGAFEVEQYPDHHMIVEFNGAQVTDHETEYFDGQIDYSVTAEVPASTVLSGTNQFTVILPGDLPTPWGDMVVLDNWSVTCPRAFIAVNNELNFTSDGEKFTITGFSPETPVTIYREDPDGDVTQITVKPKNCTGSGASCQITFAGTGENASYYVASETAKKVPAYTEILQEFEDISSGTTEYLIISHDDFIDENLALFAQYRNSQYSVRIASLSQVLAQYGNYRFDPEGIKAYIKHAVENMGTRFVLLVGGDTHDYFNYLNQHNAPISFIPSIYDAVGYQRKTPQDARYVDVDNNGVPDAAIGRWPVRTSDELAVAVNKTITYEAPKDYDRKTVFAADVRDENSSHSFADDSEALIGKLPPTWQGIDPGSGNPLVTRAYMDDDGAGNPYLLDADPDNDTASQRLINAINEGVVLTSFAGHSDSNWWSYENLLTTPDVLALTNFGRPTVVTQWGCWNTYYTKPTEDTMAHHFMLSTASNGDVSMAPGAVAVLGASALTDADAEREHAMLVYDQLFDPHTTIGEAVLEAKKQFAKTRPEQYDIIFGITLLGDPALVVNPGY